MPPNEEAPPPWEDDDIEALFDEFFDEEPSEQDNQLAQLQEDLESERDARREERFIWIVISVILLNVVFLSVLESFTAPLVLLIL